MYYICITNTIFFMVSKTKIKEIHALAYKKFRDEQNLFVAEGDKLVSELLPVFDCEWLIARPQWITARGDLHVKELIPADDDGIRKLSFLKTPPDVFAVFRIPAYRLEEADPASQLILALDGIQDPGNLGTILRIASWFGIEHVVCSQDTADVFSPKTVQATMGALAQVKVHYANLDEYILENKNAPVYGTFLNGDNIFKKKLSRHGIIVMGNEGNGIRPGMEDLITERLFVPPYPPKRKTSQSLNVAMATAIICAQFRYLDNN